MLVNDLKLILRFNSTSLYEDVSQTYMSVLGDDNVPQILSDGGGYAMQNDQYLFGDGILSNGYALDITTAFTLGFWLYPVHPGLAIYEGNPVSIAMPLFNFVQLVGSVVESVLHLTENTVSDGNNYLTVSLNNDAYSVSSENYLPGLWHYFWIVYNGISLFIYIDGKLQVLQNITGSVPSELGSGGASPSDVLRLDFYINHNLAGYAYNIAKNYGYIDDIIMFNTPNISEVDIQKIINDGVEYVTDTLYADTLIYKNSIYFYDPNTITITSSIDDMSYIYLGRNDGKILKGSPLLWEVRRNFANVDEMIVSGLTKDDMSNDKFLKLTDKNIRL